MNRPHPSRRRSSRSSSLSKSSITILASSLLLLNILSSSPTSTVLASNTHARFAKYWPHFLQVAGFGDKLNDIKTKTPHELPVKPVVIPDSGIGGGSGGTGTLPQQAKGKNNAKNPKGKQSPQQSAPSPTMATTSKGAEQGLNLQTFTGSLGGIKAPSITMSTVDGQPFMVDKATFGDFFSASQKACDMQRQMCQEVANREPGQDSQPSRTPKAKKGKRSGEQSSALPGIRGAFTASDCNSQRTQCDAAQRNAPFQTFNLDNLGTDPLDPEFELLCMP